MTTHTTAPRTFSTLGTITVGATDYMITVERATKFTPGTWSRLADRNLNVLTFETNGDKVSDAEVMARAVAEAHTIG